MTVRKVPQPGVTRQQSGRQGSEPLVIERSADPLQFLSNLLKLAGSLAAQWGEEILLHLQVATLWIRIGKNEQAIEYLTSLASLHAVDAFNLGTDGVKLRLDMMGALLKLFGIDDAVIRQRDQSESTAGEKFFKWFTSSKIGKMLHVSEMASNMLNEQELGIVRDIAEPHTSWLERVYLTPIPGDSRGELVRELAAISEYGDPDEVAKRLLQLFDHCRNWHERQADTPVWVHDLDDIGPRAMYIATWIKRPMVIVTYLERCIDALHERPLALMPNIATAIGGLAYVAKRERRDDLLNRALDAMPRLPEHERCISILNLVEVLLEP